MTHVSGEVFVSLSKFLIVEADEVDYALSIPDPIPLIGALDSGRGLWVNTGRESGLVAVDFDYRSEPPPAIEIDQTDGWDVCQELSVELRGPVCCIASVFTAERALTDGDLFVADGWVRFRVQARNRDVQGKVYPLDKVAGSFRITAWPEDSFRGTALVGEDLDIHP